AGAQAITCFARPARSFRQPRIVLGHWLLEDSGDMPIDLALALPISTLRRKPIAFVPAGSAVPALCLLALLPRLRLLLAGLLRFALLAPALRLLLLVLLFARLLLIDLDLGL